MNEDFRTPARKKRDRRDAAVYAEYMTLTADKAKSKIQVMKYLVEKYGFAGIGSIYQIKKRVEERKYGNA